MRRRDIGFAGRKDKRAITRQVFSIHTPGKRPEDFPELRVKNTVVLWADIHTNKLRVGELLGNRFSVRLRDVAPMRVLEANKILQRLAKEGVPNYFGEQRFGSRGEQPRGRGAHRPRGVGRGVQGAHTAPPPTRRRTTHSAPRSNSRRTATMRARRKRSRPH